MSRKLVSVGDTLARDGETFLDVVHRKEWGEGGPGVAELRYLQKEMADPEFPDVWSGGKDAKRRTKFVYGLNRILAPVSEGVVARKFDKARRFLRFLKPQLGLHVQERWVNNVASWEVTLLPCSGGAPVTLLMLSA